MWQLPKVIMSSADKYLAKQAIAPVYDQNTKLQSLCSSCSLSSELLSLNQEPLQVCTKGAERAQKNKKSNLWSCLVISRFQTRPISSAFSEAPGSFR